MAETETTHVGTSPGDDIPVRKSDDLSVINAVMQARHEAWRAKQTRMKKNEQNIAAFLSEQDWSHKTEGQSREFLPKTAVAVEQFAAFIKRALIQFGSWYEVELGMDSRSPISGESIRNLMNCLLDEILVSDNTIEAFSTIFPDGIKVGALESLMIFKVHGNMVEDRMFVAQEGAIQIGDDGSLERGAPELETQTIKKWVPRIDLIPGQDYYPDPTGNGLYEIHSTTQDFYKIKEDAERGIYDMSAVLELMDSERARDEARRDEARGQDDATLDRPSFRKQIQIDEYWGTILDSDGDVVHRNIVCTIANKKHLIRKPTPNPFWHQESPFVAAPLIRVPWSVWHKALFDDAAQLNFALNEMFNLILDGGLASVWGVKQIRLDMLEDPSQVSDGISQGDTIAVKGTLPFGEKVLETVTEGQIPPDALAAFDIIVKEFTSAALSNELRLGSLPQREVKATEVIELSQSQAVTLDSISGELEKGVMSKILRLLWLTSLQNMDDLGSEAVINSMGLKPAFAMAQMAPAERFAVFGSDCAFKVKGLSSTLAKVRDFQKVMALLQSVVANPILMQAFFKRYSPDKILSHMMKTLNINPTDMHRDKQELERVEADFQELGKFAQLGSGGTGISGGGDGNGGGGGLPNSPAGGPQTGAETNQIQNPITGSAPNA